MAELVSLLPETEIYERVLGCSPTTTATTNATNGTDDKARSSGASMPPRASSEIRRRSSRGRSQVARERVSEWEERVCEKVSGGGCKCVRKGGGLVYVIFMSYVRFMCYVRFLSHVRVTSYVRRRS